MVTLSKKGGDDVLGHVRRLLADIPFSSYDTAVVFTAEGASTLLGRRFMLPGAPTDDTCYTTHGGTLVSTLMGVAAHVSGSRVTAVPFEAALADVPSAALMASSDFMSPAYREAAYLGVPFVVDRPMKVQGWVNKGFAEALRAALDAMPEGPLLVVELGTWMGISTNMMANDIKGRGDRHAGSVVVAVDTWLGSAEHFLSPESTGCLIRDHGYPRLYRTFLQHTKQRLNHDIISPLPLPTMQAAFVLAASGVPVDLVYVDAAHDEAAVYADIRAYLPMLRPGTGRMIGDDWAWEGVRRAAERFAAEEGIRVLNEGGVWWFVQAP